MKKQHLLYRAEDRSTLRKLGIWIECLALALGSLLLGILLLT
ncbi:hypothetical protein [uncultured Microbulbifer sp.]|nr:hypothetical protein [uncultured Microbulbifer sp.]